MARSACCVTRVTGLFDEERGGGSSQHDAWALTLYGKVAQLQQVGPLTASTDNYRICPATSIHEGTQPNRLGGEDGNERSKMRWGPVEQLLPRLAGLRHIGDERTGRADEDWTVTGAEDAAGQQSAPVETDAHHSSTGRMGTSSYCHVEQISNGKPIVNTAPTQVTVQHLSNSPQAMLVSYFFEAPVFAASKEHVPVASKPQQRKGSRHVTAVSEFHQVLQQDENGIGSDRRNESNGIRLSWPYGGADGGETHAPVSHHTPTPGSLSPSLSPQAGKKRKRADRATVWCKPTREEGQGGVALHDAMQGISPSLGWLCPYVTPQRCRLNRASEVVCGHAHMARAELALALQNSRTVSVLRAQALNRDHRDYSQEKAELWASAKESTNRFEYVVDHNHAWFQELRQAAYQDAQEGQRRATRHERAPQFPRRNSARHSLDIPLDEQVEAVNSGIMAIGNRQSQPLRQTNKRSQRNPTKRRLCSFIDRNTCSQLNMFVSGGGRKCQFAHLKPELMYEALTTSHSVEVAISQMLNPRLRSYSKGNSEIWQRARMSENKWEYVMQHRNKFFIQLRQIAYEDWCAAQVAEAGDQ